MILLHKLLLKDDALNVLLDADIDFSEEDVSGLLNGVASSFYGYLMEMDIVLPM